MSNVLAASFGPDKLFQVVFPGQKQYPDDYCQPDKAEQGWQLQPGLQLCDYATYRHILTIGQELTTITYDYAHHQLISGLFKQIADPYLVDDELIVSVTNPFSDFHFQAYSNSIYSSGSRPPQAALAWTWTNWTVHVNLNLNAELNQSTVHVQLN